MWWRKGGGRMRKWRVGGVDVHVQDDDDDDDDAVEVE